MPNHALNIGIEALCIVVCAILIIQMLQRKARGRRTTDKWFTAALASNIAMMLGDMVNWIFHGMTEIGVRTLLFSGTTIYFASSGVIMFSFYMYIHTYISERKPLPSYLVTLNAALMAAQVVFAAISPFTGAVFTYSAENEYQRGFMFLVSQGIPVASYLTSVFIIIYGSRSLRRKELIYFCIYLVLLSASEIMQVMNYGMPLLNIALTLAFLLVSLFINSEIDEWVRKVEKDHEDERIALLEDLQKTWQGLTEQTILALSNAVEAKDRYTSGHSRRVAEYSAEIVRRMGWNEEQQKYVYYAGLLHDVGKIRVADAIINKNGRLDDEEFDAMKVHPLSGYYILKEISSISDFAVGARWHHERYDGRGYPNGLSGEEIPIIARVIGVADAYDAMTSNRSYRSVMPQEKVRGEIEKGAGTQFDPEIARIMLEMIDEDKFYLMRQINSSEDKSVLIIESGEELYSAVSELKYAVRRASNAIEAAAVLRMIPINLVLLNVEEPDELETTLSIIKNPESASNTERSEELRVVKYIDTIPLIIVTDKKELLRTSERYGIADCITKPFTRRMIIESVQNILLKSDS